MIGFIVIVTILGLLMLLERIYPDRPLPMVKNWWLAVISINICQLCVVIVSGYTWEKWLNVYPSLINLHSILEPKFGNATPMVGGLIAYLTNTWFFYWWHYARHEIYLFWLAFHQLHHSAQRIEAITSFYKHPFEIIADSILMSILLYPILGLKIDSSIWLSIPSALGEYFYHMNIATPQWIGYFFQRPESHREHHLLNKRLRCKNFSDLPLWDMLGGTFYNPEKMTSATGFNRNKELARTDILLLKDVVNPDKKIRLSWATILHLLLFILGSMQMFAYVFSMPNLRGIAIATCSSPLPLVFSATNGVETFSTSYVFDIIYRNSTKQSMPMTWEIYNAIDGPYNYRNIYGAVFSHGPFFTSEPLIKLRDQILHKALCEGYLKVTDDQDQISQVRVTVNGRSVNNTQIRQMMWIDC